MTDPGQRKLQVKVLMWGVARGRRWRNLWKASRGLICGKGLSLKNNIDEELLEEANSSSTMEGRD